MFAVSVLYMQALSTYYTLARMVACLAQQTQDLSR